VQLRCVAGCVACAASMQVSAASILKCAASTLECAASILVDGPSYAIAWVQQSHVFPLQTQFQTLPACLRMCCVCAQVREVKPGSAVSIIETDVNLEFEAPKDYKEPTPAAAVPLQAQPAAAAAADGQPGSSAAAAAEPEEPEEPKFVPFVGSGRRLDGKAGSSSPAAAAAAGGAGSSGSAAAAAARRAAAGSSSGGSGGGGGSGSVGGPKPGTFVSTGNRLLDKLEMDKVGVWGCVGNEMGCVCGAGGGGDVVHTRGDSGSGRGGVGVCAQTCTLCPSSTRGQVQGQPADVALWSGGFGCVSQDTELCVCTQLHASTMHMSTAAVSTQGAQHMVCKRTHPSVPTLSSCSCGAAYAAWVCRVKE
jgi:hypothetical protein